MDVYPVKAEHLLLQNWLRWYGSFIFLLQYTDCDTSSLPTSLSTKWFTELRKNSSDLQRISKIICRSKFLAGNIRHGCFHLIDVCIHFRISGFGIRKVTRTWWRAGWLISGIIPAGTLLPGHHLFCHSTSCIIWAATWTVHLIIFHEQILSVTNNMSLYFMT